MSDFWFFVCLKGLCLFHRHIIVHLHSFTFSLKITCRQKMNVSYTTCWPTNTKHLFFRSQATVDLVCLRNNASATCNISNANMSETHCSAQMIDSVTHEMVYIVLNPPERTDNVRGQDARHSSLHSQVADHVHQPVVAIVPHLPPEYVLEINIENFNAFKIARSISKTVRPILHLTFHCSSNQLYMKTLFTWILKVINI